MEKTEKRKLLYYDRFQRTPKHYMGEPVYHFFFKDVETGEDIILGQCYYAKEVSDILDEIYYFDITEATNNYDILWNLSEEKIRPVTDTFKEVQFEYKRMLNNGVDTKDINSEMISLFKEKTFQKSLM